MSDVNLMLNIYELDFKTMGLIINQIGIESFKNLMSSLDTVIVKTIIEELEWYDAVVLFCSFSAADITLLFEWIKPVEILSLVTRVKPNTIMELLYNLGGDNLRQLVALHPLDVKIIIEYLGEEKFWGLLQYFTPDQIIQLIQELGAGNFVKLFEIITPEQMIIQSKHMDKLKQLRQILDHLP